MILDKLSGAMFGVAVGDALGAPVEFMDKSEIRQKFGVLNEMVGGGWLNLSPGEVTDDTEMSICVAEGIIENCENPVPAIGHRFITWAQHTKDIGNTCSLSINRAKQAMRRQSDSNSEVGIWIRVAHETHQLLEIAGSGSAGNGGLMRTIYPALYYQEEKRAAEIAILQSQMTHYDAVSSQACSDYVRVIHRLLGGMSLLELRQFIEMHYPICLEQAFVNTSGYVLDTLHAAFNAVLTTDSFEKALIKAVNSGGDTDTVGAVTGGLAGAQYGYSNIPKRWLQALSPTIQSCLDRLVDEAHRNNDIKVGSR
ncbi:ADP-ribosyl-[dinitrogen reductase] glycohydrolase [compost metagenome]